MNFVQDKNIAKLTTFGVPALCERYVEVNSESEVHELFKNHEFDPFLVLGGGSNMLFTKPYSGTVIRNCIKGFDVVRKTDEHVWVRIGGGEVWHDVVLKCIENNWGGIENLSLIPGCVGAAPIQNIGAYGVEIKDVLESVTALVQPNNQWEVFDVDACQLGYRDSIFKRELKGKAFVSYVVLRLDLRHTLKTKYGAIQEELKSIPEDQRSISDVSNAVIKIRSEKLPNPKILGNAGSFFKNPVIPNIQFKSLQKQFPDIPSYPISKETVKVPAGWLIEKRGWKGKRIGNTGCHKNQALVLVNYDGKATGEEIYQHALNVINDVNEGFGIVLEPEVNIF